ncbi:MAG: YgiQ family radical SAM protein [Bacteroidota bacterium]
MKPENFLPTTKKEAEAKNWHELDVILFTGDAYIDHPSFGIAIIARVLENMGLKVAVVPQPNWQDDLRDFKKLGTPKLFFGVSSGNMDSMVNHYTANKRLRHNDAYTPGGRHGARPDYATIVYSKILRNIFPNSIIVIGGIEASLRRFTHYDYWSDLIKPSILKDSEADILVYGMGEKAVADIAKNIITGETLANIPQTAIISDTPSNSYFSLHSFEDCQSGKMKFAENFKAIEIESNKVEQNGFNQKTGDKFIIVNPPYPLASENELDAIYDLPFTRLPHPKYDNKPVIPAYEMIRHSVTLHRGCFGGCSFCTISAHQGKFIASRSEKSILKEVDNTVNMHDFKSYISDLGGPSANMYKMEPVNINICKKCHRPSCIYPEICKNLNGDHSALIKLYKSVNKNPKIKKAIISSGIRYDLIYNQKNPVLKKTASEYIKIVISNHVSGRLKVAPEHTKENVLKSMRKPDFSLFRQLISDFNKINSIKKLNQQIVPYFIASHPECKVSDMAEMAIETKKMGFRLEQIQDYTPTPLTLSNVLYYTGINPYTKKPVHIARSRHEREVQNKMIFWYKNNNKQFLISELKKLQNKKITELLFGKK